MRIAALALVASLVPTGLLAESVVAARVIRARSIIAPADLVLVAQDLPGAVLRPQEAVGKEARKTIYAGRPILAEDIGPPAVIERNQIVVLAYSVGGLTIEAEGRALDRAAIGESLRVINAGSRAVLFGIAASDGTVRVAPGS